MTNQNNSASAPARGRAHEMKDAIRKANAERAAENQAREAEKRAQASANAPPVRIPVREKPQTESERQYEELKALRIENEYLRKELDSTRAKNAELKDKLVEASKANHPNT